jgi:hypothetical protein
LDPRKALVTLRCKRSFGVRKLTATVKRLTRSVSGVNGAVSSLPYVKLFHTSWIQTTNGVHPSLVRQEGLDCIVCGNVDDGSWWNTISSGKGDDFGEEDNAWCISWVADLDA